MIELRIGNIFDTDSQALVNPVNTDGIMGKGLAYQFKIKYPLNFKNYVEKCKSGAFDVGTDLIYTKENNKIIINFPTKKNWKENSKIEYIEIGLKKLNELIKKENISSISIPPLGAGNGKLDWILVKKEIFNFEKNIPNVKIIIYEPTNQESKLHKGHLLLTKVILRSYELGLKKEELNDFLLQKITYLGDTKNYFKFYKYTKGPFSKLINIFYNDLKKYSRITSKKLSSIEKELEKDIISDSLLTEEKNIIDGINLYKDLKKYYNLSYENIHIIEEKVELLTSILLILEEKKDPSPISIFNNLKSWNDRKKKYTLKDINEIFNFLIKENIISTNIFGEYQYKKK